MAEDIVAYLTGEGVERHEAELIAQDVDLWICDPVARYGFEGEEAIEQWRAGWST